MVAQVVAHGYRLQRGECGGGEWLHRTSLGTCRTPTYRTCRGRCEVEAESVTYVVNAAQGLDVGAYTFGYVAGCAGGDVGTVRSSGELVVGVARRVLAASAPAPTASSVA